MELDNRKATAVSELLTDILAAREKFVAAGLDGIVATLDYLCDIEYLLRRAPGDDDRFSELFDESLIRTFLDLVTDEPIEALMLQSESLARMIADFRANPESYE
jgi:hypothetical protein